MEENHNVGQRLREESTSPIVEKVETTCTRESRALQIYILQTIGGFEEDGSSRGGPLHLLGLAKEWRALGHDVHFITNRSDRGESQYRGLSSVQRVPTLGVLSLANPHTFLIETLMNPLVQAPSLKQIIKRTRKQGARAIVIAGSPYPSDVVNCLMLGRGLNLRQVVYLHHLSQPPWWHPLRRGSIARITFNWLVTLLTLSLSKIAHMLPCIDQPRTLSESGWRFETGIMQNRNFVESTSNPSVTVVQSESQRGKKACFIGMVAPNKGVIDLLEAWEIVIGLVPDAELTIAGRVQSPSFGHKMERLVRESGLSNNVQLMGYVDSDTKVRILERSRLFVFPSYEEGWSIGAMEAAMRGALPVTYDLPAYEYLGRAAVKVPVGNIKELARAVAWLLTDERERSDRVAQINQNLGIITRHSIASEQVASLQEFCDKGLIGSPTASRSA